MTTLEHGLSIEHNTSSVGKSMSQMHEHSYYELYFLLSGKRRYLIKDTVYEIEPGNLMMIPKNQLHRTIAPAKSGYDRYAVYFFDCHADLLTAMIGSEAFDTLIHSGCLQFSPSVAAAIQTDLEQLHRILMAPQPYAAALTTHLFNGIMLRALQYGSSKERLSDKNADRIQFIAQYISKNFQEEITLASAAKMAGFEKTYFSKLFRSITGFGFQDYLLQTRVLAAEQLLQRSDLSINMIAESCGFSGGNYFGDVFRRYRGISPTEYKKTFE